MKMTPYHGTDCLFEKIVTLSYLLGSSDDRVPDTDAVVLLEDKLFYIQVLDSESYQKRRRNRDEGGS